MRFLRLAFCSLVILTQTAFGQQFYRSAGFDLFNQQNFQNAIDSLDQWIQNNPGKAGIAYHFIGESYYNLALSDRSTRARISELLQNSLNAFTTALQQPDLEISYPEKPREAYFKIGWCLHRMAELGNATGTRLDAAIQAFTRVQEGSADTLAIISRYMLGECHFQKGRIRRAALSESDDVDASAVHAQEALNSYSRAQRAFSSAIRSPNIAYYLRNAARIRRQDMIYEKGMIFHILFRKEASYTAFESLLRMGDFASARDAAVHYFQQLHYAALFDSLDARSLRIMDPILRHSHVQSRLQLYLISGDIFHRNELDNSISGIQDDGQLVDREFILANREHRRSLNKDVLLQLSNNRTSYYRRAADRQPESWYWLGWMQFLANSDESEGNFQKFIEETESLPRDQFLSVLREDAQYRIFLAQFDRNTSRLNILRELRSRLTDFNPQNPGVREESNLLLKLVRVGLGESIWGEVLEGGSREQRLQEAFRLIMNMFIRATGVTGEEREVYLTYLDKLFQITQDQYTERTQFFRGLSEFLRAEIQETKGEKRQYYLDAADILKRSLGRFRDEALYVQARSYFAAAKHEGGSSQRVRMLNRAKPIFQMLINDKQSMRSVYYLGEIFRILGNDIAARRCYEIVRDKTEGYVESTFWYENAVAGLDSCGTSGNISELDGIEIDQVRFPERLLVINGEVISLEKFADPDYIRGQYWEKSISILINYGFTRRNFYPSLERIHESLYNRAAFENVSARIKDRKGKVYSGLEMFVFLPPSAGKQPVEVLVNGAPLEPVRENLYQKQPLPINQSINLDVKHPSVYSHIRKIRLLYPGLSHFSIHLYPKIRFISQGETRDEDIAIARFPERWDGNIVIHKQNLPVSRESELYQDFISDIHYRDFVYASQLDGYLAVNSMQNQLTFYRNDAQISREGSFPLRIPAGASPLLSPEGIDIDQQGNLYIVDWGSHRIHIFKNDGSLIRSFGHFGINTQENREKEEVSLAFPTRIAVLEDTRGTTVNNQRVFSEPKFLVSDRYGVHLVDFNGVYLDTFFANNEQYKGSIYGLAAHGYGDETVMYVAERHRGVVETFKASPLQ
jgi:tetratricopeptide (TPR) repeat protein